MALSLSGCMNNNDHCINYIYCIVFYQTTSVHGLGFVYIPVTAKKSLPGKFIENPI